MTTPIIESIAEKYEREWAVKARHSIRDAIKAALTEFSAGGEAPKCCAQCSVLADAPDGSETECIDPKCECHSIATPPIIATTAMMHAGYEVHKHLDVQCFECGEIWAAMYAYWSKHQ